MNTTNKYIILFDGACNFCSFWVEFIIKRDKANLFRFAPLQSEIGIKLLKKYHVSSTVDSVVLIEKEQAYIKSTAAFHILKILGGFWFIFYGLIIIPKPIRDFFYDVTSRFRYKIFGKSVCRFPINSDDSERFL